MTSDVDTPAGQGAQHSQALENCACPFCHADASLPWAVERGFQTVRCQGCGLLYLNPRPSQAARDEATQRGAHAAAGDLDISERHVPAKSGLYRKIIAAVFSDVWEAGKPVSWLDIGAGYGEVMDAVRSIAPAGSRIVGVEPMASKAAAAQRRGLDVLNSYVDGNTPRVGYASLINVFSHVYDFDLLLRDIHGALLPGGELLIETGDMTLVKNRSDVPSELGSPDHVVFAGEAHVRGYLERNGFDVVSVTRARVDDLMFTLKNVAKRLLGRTVVLGLPYQSPYRTMYVRAKKK